MGDELTEQKEKLKEDKDYNIPKLMPLDWVLSKHGEQLLHSLMYCRLHKFVNDLKFQKLVQAAGYSSLEVASHSSPSLAIGGQGHT